MGALPETGALWIKDFLPLDVPGARVLTFGYNANDAFGYTTADIIDHAQDLLGCLIDRREEDDVSRPLRDLCVATLLTWSAIGNATPHYFYRSFSRWYCCKAGELLLVAK